MTAGGMHANNGEVTSMKKDQAARFSEEMEQYRRSLLYLARKDDWAAFQARAESLFEHVENVESAERTRRFWQVFTSILAVLVLSVAALLGAGPEFPSGLPYSRNMLILAALGVSSFELYFYINFRIYNYHRMLYVKKRKEAFIRGMMSDFRSLVREPASRGR